MDLSISIVIPAYNAEKHLAQCLQAAFSSLASTDEIIVVDDGSDDGTSLIIDDKKCKKIRLEKNSGAAHARNQGANRADKDLIFFLDSDVLISKENVDRMRKYFQEKKEVHSLTVNLDIKDKGMNFPTDFKCLYMNYIINDGGDSVNYIYGSFCATRRLGFVSWPEKMRLTEDSLWGHQQKMQGLNIHCLKDVGVRHLKEHNILSLIKNDFFISSSFARSFMEYKRWSTLYTRESFGHTSKLQKISVIFSMITAIAYFFSTVYGLCFFLLWIIFNGNFLRFLYEKRGFMFLLKSIGWYYFDCLVYFMGICHGVFSYGQRKFAVLERETI